MIDSTVQNKENILYSQIEKKIQDSIIYELNLNNNDFRCIGMWKDCYMNINIFLLQEDHNYFLLHEYNDGSFYKQIVEFSSDGKNGMMNKMSNITTEFYIINETNLEFWDNKGLIDIYKTCL